MLHDEIAIIGVSGIYPEADDLRAFYLNLSNGRDSVREVSPERKSMALFDPDAPLPVVASIDRIDRFDHEFFNISPREAEYMDPQQRLLLQLACAAIENAGYSLRRMRGSNTSVVLSATNNDYSKFFERADPTAVTGILPAALAGRIAYALDLRGPAMVIDTACSSSLVAVHEACKKLYLREADLALCGGINLFFMENKLGSEASGIIAPDGKSKAFDAAADGAGWGEGGGVIVLKLLDKAVEDGDNILAVIKGGAINQDGGRSNGLTAPSPQAQAEVIVQAWRNARVDPSTISYIEAHGTGTQLGDPIEIQGLTDAFGRFTDKKKFCAIGSVKTNIGHLVGAAGIAALTKIILSLKRKKLLPSLNFNTPNPYIDFDNTAVFVNTRFADWETGEGAELRRAGVSSFGLSGTNCHLVLEEAPRFPARADDPDESEYLITLSAKTPAALESYKASLIHFLEENEVSIKDLSFTLNCGRDDYQHRYATVAASADGLLRTLSEAAGRDQRDDRPIGKPVTGRPVIMLFSGDSNPGSEASKRLRDNYGIYRETVEKCYAIAGERNTTPSLQTFTDQYALYEQLTGLGISAGEVIGNGVGNLVVAVITGKMSLEEAVAKAAAYDPQGAHGAQRAVDLKKLGSVVASLSQGVQPVFLEMGPKGALLSGIESLRDEVGEVITLAAVEDGAASLARTLARLYEAGADIDWDRRYKERKGRRIECPSYPFAQTRCWISDPANPIRNGKQAAKPPQPAVAVEAVVVTEEDASPLEKRIAAIWGDVLKLKELSIDADFFDLGGSSLNGMQMVNRIEKELNLPLDFDEVYDHSTIRALAEFMAPHLPEALQLQSSPDRLKAELQTDRLKAELQTELQTRPLSAGQQRLWAIDQIDPGSPVYNVPTDVRIEGALNVPALGRSVNEVARRHEILRTTFVATDGRPSQVVSSRLTLPIPIVDLTALSEEEKARQAREIAVQEAQQPFDLSLGPLVRVGLIKLAERDHVLTVTMHHIVSDGWSSGVLINELGALYNAFSADLPSPLPELAIQYGDYANWERDWLQGEAVERQIEYWKRQLKGADSVLDLPADRPRPAAQTYRGARQYLNISREVSEGLKKLCRREGATLYMGLLAGFKALLSRYSRQEEISVGTPVANRRLVETEELIGFFVNTVVMRTDLGGAGSYAEVLRRVKEVALGAYSHQEAPFEKLVEELKPERSLSHSPLFQVVFVLQNTPIAPVEVAGLTISPYEVDRGTSMFDMTITLGEIPDGPTGPSGLIGWWEYNSDLFDDATIERMIGHYRTLLEAMAADADRSIHEVALADAAEREKLLVEWNDTARDYPRDRCFHELFQRQVEQTPDLIAVECEGVTLTYAELNRKANQLARHLGKRGVKPEVRVAICAERSLELAVGILGVLKAGGAYAPLDPSYPARRLEFIVDDSRSALLLTQNRLVERVSTVNAPLVRLDSDWSDIARESGDDLPNYADPRNLAYVIYTSGSTGNPKGTLIEHRGLVNYLLWAVEAYRAREGRGAPVNSSVGFDLTITSLLTPLIAGKTVTMLADSGGIEPLERALRDQGDFALVKITPAHLDALNWSLSPGEARGGTKTFVIGGEALRYEHVTPWRRRAPETRLINEYGPTETVVGCAVYEIRPQDGLTGPVPIGRPIANTRLYVLDEGFNPAPIGIPGELYIGGDGVARGYLGRPEMTAEKFIPDPFSGKPGARLYRSGDLARYLKDGNLDFIGRIDEQVKVRGFRIELAEIESALLGYPSIEQAVAVAREDAPGSKRLVAYFVTSNGIPASGEMRDYLKGRLPEYMIPSNFVALDRMPLTSNGKVDRQALPAPAESRAESGPAETAPRNDIERTLAEIWRETLGVESVGVHDNIYDLGGDSIINIQIIAKAKRAGLSFTPKQFMQHQTIAQLAEAISQGARSVPGDQRQAPATGLLPMTPIQQWFFENVRWGESHWNQALLLQSAERLDAGRIERAVNHLIDHHEGLRARFVKEDGRYICAEIIPHAAVRVAEFDLAGFADQERVPALTARATEIQQSFKLDEPPLIRAAVFHVGGERPSRLLIAIHHLVVDGVSWRILLEDLQTVCERLGRNEHPDLPARTASFKTWAEGIERYANSAALLDQSDYWLRPAGGELRPLPVDFANGENDEASARVVSVSFRAEETSSLIRRVPKAYRARADEALLAALVDAFRDWTGSETLLIDLESHGRQEIVENADLSRTVGWFTSLYPMWFDAEGTTLPGELLGTIKEQARRAPDGGIGYGALKYLSRDAHLIETMSELPKAEVSFNYLGRFDNLASADSILSQAREPIGPSRSPLARRTHLLEINASVSDGRLRVDFGYSENRHKRKSIEELAARFKQAVKSLLAHCRDWQTGEHAIGHTVSDFPLARVTRQTLDSLAIRCGEIEDIYPLSPVQKGMLFHSVYAPESGVYVNQLCWKLRGELDPASFEKAWQSVVDANPILRTAFFWESLDEPLQAPLAKVVLPVEMKDWRDLPHGDQEKRIKLFIGADRARGFDLSKAPLMRLTLIRRADDVYQLIWTHHHLLLDGWSMGIVLNQVFACYDAHRNGERIEIAHGRPYSDYVAWLEGRDWSEAESFWRDLLKGFTAPTPLPGGRTTADDEKEPEYRQVAVRLPEPLTADLQAMARRRRLTLNTILQAAWALQLSKHSGESDVVFGATVSGRPVDLIGVDLMAGVFINTLPVRVKIPDHGDLLSWLERMRADLSEWRERENTPLALIQALSETPTGAPLFESLLVFENYPVDAALKARAADGNSHLEIEDFHALEQTNYPLTVIVTPGPSLDLRVSYDRGRIDDESAACLLRGLETLLEAFVAHPTRNVSRFSPLAATERKRLLEDWNATEKPYHIDQCLHHLFEAQALRTPNHTALVFEGQRLTYTELNERANRLAHFIGKLGAGQETLVAVCLERSVEMVVALLAALKAGCAYVPLDPSYPTERLAYMLEDAGAPLLLTQENLLDTLPFTAARAICLDRDWDEIESESRDNPSLEIEPHNLAYMIYTSGSTGRPKGAMNSHRAICNRLLWMQDEYRLESADRVLQKTPFSFDVSVWEFFWPLITGATLVVARPGGHQDSSYLTEIINREKITTIHFVPSMLQAFLEAEDVESCVCLKQVICSGEALPTGAIAKFQSKLKAGLHNLYGPTEAAVDVTYWACEENPERAPIGRPIANTQTYILDEGMEPTPIGVSGELHLGGVCLGRGYHERPELTAERFIPNPFGVEEGTRLYKTGDLARYLADGNIEYLGRTDHQVKIRGFRIELGEIETAIAAHTSIRECVVVVREDGPGEKRLVAYAVAAREHEPSTSEIRSHLRQTLPEYMLPSVFVFVEAMPLSANGKVDRRALPDPGRARPKTESVFVEPRNAVEEKLAAIWAESLRVDRVGVYDNLFEMGGDSIISLQVTARANQAGIRLTPRQVFERQTIAELAAVAGTAREIESEQGEVTGRAPLTPIQKWFFEQDLVNPHHWNQSVTLDVAGEMNPSILEQAFNHLLQRHDALRLRFSKEDGAWLQRNEGFDGNSPLARIDLSAVPESDQQRKIEAAAAELQASLNLDRGPIIGVALFDRGPGKPARLLIVVHHLAIDGVSWRILLEDLQLTYAQLGRGEEARLGAKTTSFKQWAERLAVHAADESLKQELGFWLANRCAVSIPLDEDGGPNTAESENTLTVWLDADETWSLLQAPPSAYGAQINDTLLAALAQTLSRWTGFDESLIDIEGHGREDLFDDINLSRTIGWFTTIFPVKLELDAFSTPGEALKSVKEQLRRVPNRGIGYGLLRYLSPDPETAAGLRAAPDAEICFNYLGQFDETVSGANGFTLVSEPHGPARDPGGRRRYLIEVNCAVIGGRLQTRWSYSGNLHREETIERLAGDFMESLRQIIEHCQSPEAGGYTTSDFPLAGLTEQRLNSLFDEIEFEA